VSWAFLALAIALVYRIFPDAKIAWRDVWVGAGVRALLFLRGNHLIGWYLAATSISSVYGAVGSIVIVLLWVYYSSQVALFVLFAGRAVRTLRRSRCSARSSHESTPNTEARLWNHKKTRYASPERTMPDGFLNYWLAV
jgi:uncharacterized BrkB/YihY/UPF0761 family membrane protein